MIERKGDGCAWSFVEKGARVMSGECKCTLNFVVNSFKKGFYEGTGS